MLIHTLHLNRNELGKNEGLFDEFLFFKSSNQLQCSSA